MTNPTVRATVATVNVAVGVGTQGPPGPAGPASAFYQHTQASPATVWVINHNLGFRPAVELLDAGGSEFDAEVIHINQNQAQVFLDIPTAGVARCN